MRRSRAQQTAHEKVRHLAHAVRSAVGVPRSWNHQQIEHLVGPDERTDHLHGRGRVDVLIELANAMLYSSLVNQTVELPIDSAAFEKKLNELIKGSKIQKKVVAVSSEDFTKSFIR
jgi:hypothetical protein